MKEQLIRFLVVCLDFLFVDGGGGGGHAWSLRNFAGGVYRMYTSSQKVGDSESSLGQPPRNYPYTNLHITKSYHQFAISLVFKKIVKGYNKAFI